jgi:hypothetical protein
MKLLTTFHTSVGPLVLYSANTGINVKFKALDNILVMKNGTVVAAKKISISVRAPNFIAITILLNKPSPSPNIVKVVTIMEDLAMLIKPALGEGLCHTTFALYVELSAFF